MENNRITYDELLKKLERQEEELISLKQENKILEEENRNLKEQQDQEPFVYRTYKKGEELQSAEYLLNCLMDSISDSIYFKNLNSEFIKVSKTFAQKHGLSSPDEAIGKSDFDYFTPEHAQKAFSDEQKIIITGEPLNNIEEKETWTDGHKTWASTTKMPLKDKHGRIIGTFGISRDITRRKKMEQALIQNEKKLSELNATKDKLLTIISHDLRNLFNAIIGFSELLLDNVRNGNIDKSERFANIIYQSARDSYELLENLLQWSRMQTGQIKFHPEKIDLHEVVQEVLNLLMSSLNAKNISVDAKTQSGTYHNADKVMISTILRNLISNAIKFTPEEGKISVLVSQTEKETRIVVRDTGVGIDIENQEKLFMINENISTKDTNDDKGTGLGLVVCKELTEKHGGQISVDSELNKGSEFTVLLPR